MSNISRRSFLGQSALGLGATVGLSQLPKVLMAGATYADIPLGFKSWVVRQDIAKDFPGKMKSVTEKG